MTIPDLTETARQLLIKNGMAPNAKNMYNMKKDLEHEWRRINMKETKIAAGVRAGVAKIRALAEIDKNDNIR